MQDCDNIEEEVTRSNFAFLLNHNLDICGSMGLFPHKLSATDISAIERRDSTQQFLHSKSSATTVFDRLITDSNRRTYASKKVNDYRLMLELEYENSFLSQAKLSKASEEALISRLVEDTNRRSRNSETIENLKKSQEMSSERESFRWSARETSRVVSRLSADTRDKFKERDRVKKNLLEEEIRFFESIRTAKHPKRKINKEVFERIISPISRSISPRCKRAMKEGGGPVRVCGSPVRIQGVVDRLHKSSPLKLYIPYSKERERSLERGKRASPRKYINEDVDDYLMKVKANGGRRGDLGIHTDRKK